MLGKTSPQQEGLSVLKNVQHHLLVPMNYGHCAFTCHFLCPCQAEWNLERLYTVEAGSYDFGANILPEQDIGFSDAPKTSAFPFELFTVPNYKQMYEAARSGCLAEQDTNGEEQFATYSAGQFAQQYDSCFPGSAFVIVSHPTKDRQRVFPVPACNCEIAQPVAMARHLSKHAGFVGKPVLCARVKFSTAAYVGKGIQHLVEPCTPGPAAANKKGKFDNSVECRLCDLVERGHANVEAWRQMLSRAVKSPRWLMPTRQRMPTSPKC